MHNFSIAVQQAVSTAIEKSPEIAKWGGASGWVGGWFYNLIAKNPSIVASVCAILGVILTAIGIYARWRQDRIRTRIQAERLKHDTGIDIFSNE